MELGVAQGSGLSPFLFIKFIKDFLRCSHIFNFVLFADDSTLYFSSPKLQSLYDTVNIELQKVTKWLHTDKLTVHTRRSNNFVFRRKKNPVEGSSNIYLDYVNFNRRETAKYLDVYINESLSWKEHIATVAKNK